VFTTSNPTRKPTIPKPAAASARRSRAVTRMPMLRNDIALL